MDKVIEHLSALKNDPNEFHQRRQEVLAKIKQEMQGAPAPRDLNVQITLDPLSAKLFRIIEIFISGIMGEDEKATVEYIMQSGLATEIEKFMQAQQSLLLLGNMEVLADQAGVSLTPDEKTIATAIPPPLPVESQALKIEDYWARGFISVSCPRCEKAAVWHPVSKECICLRCHFSETTEGPLNERKV